MKVELCLGSDRRETLWLNGKEFNESISYEVSLEALRRAKRMLENGINNTASGLQHEALGGFIWCYTAEHFRGENIDGVLRRIYLIELLKHLSNNYNIHVIFSLYWPPALMKLLKDTKISIKVNLTISLKRRIYLQAAFIWRSSNDLMRIFNGLKHRPLVKSSLKILLDVNKSPKSQRIGDLDRLAGIEEWIGYFSGQQYSINGFPEERVVSFIDWITFKDVVLSIKKVLLIYKVKIENRHSISPYLYNALSPLVDFRLLLLLLYFEGALKFFKRHNIQIIYHVSTFNQASYRLLMKAAEISGVNFCVIASRTLYPLRLSDSYISADLARYGDVSVPDKAIVRDDFSRRVLTNGNFKGNIGVASRYENNGKKGGIDSWELEILILTTHVHDVSLALLKFVLNMNFRTGDIKDIWVKSHPSCPFPQKVLGQISDDIRVKTFEENDYSRFVNKKLLVISGPTSAALEVVSVGCLLVWLPFVWADGILFEEIMNLVGVKVKSEKEFKKIIGELLVISDEEYLKQSLLTQEVVESNFKAKSHIVDHILEEFDESSYC